MPHASLASNGPPADQRPLRRFRRAQVNFYNDAAAPNPATSPVLEPFNLDAGVIVNGVTTAGGQLAGVGTSFFDDFVPSGGSASPLTHRHCVGRSRRQRAANGAFDAPIAACGPRPIEVAVA